MTDRFQPVFNKPRFVFRINDVVIQWMLEGDHERVR
jgi:hypothetical protein